MSILGEKIWYGYRPNTQGFDEVRIITVPRYKQSGLSGDEWRISSETRFYRAGVLIHSVAHGNVETACGMAYGDYVSAISDGKGYFAGDGTRCDQEGCAEHATVFYQMKKQFCREGHETTPHNITIRSFCERHKQRGDCSLDDADRNYEPWMPF